MKKLKIKVLNAMRKHYRNKNKLNRYNWCRRKLYKLTGMKY